MPISLMMTFFSMSKSSVAQAGPEDVGEDVHGLRQVLGQHGGVEDGVFLAGEGVVVGADAVEVAVDVEGGALRACP